MATFSQRYFKACTHYHTPWLIMNRNLNGCYDPYYPNNYKKSIHCYKLNILYGELDENI